MLNINNLEINKSKTEKYHINVKKRNKKSWKKCRYLGSRLHIKTDIIQRKILMTMKYNILEKPFRSKCISKELKIKLLTIYIESICERTKENSWSTKIFKRHLGWLGHLL